MQDKSITLVEFIEIAILFSLPVSLINRIFEIVVLRIYKIKWIRVLILMFICQLISLILTIAFWKVSVFEGDGFLFRYIFLPALYSEIMILALSYWYFKKVIIKWS